MRACLTRRPPPPLLTPPLTPPLLLVPGFLVLHVEPEQRQQVDLEQLLTGEPPPPLGQGPPTTPTCQAAQGPLSLTLWVPGGTK